MAVFNFIVKHSRGTWTAKQHGGEADLEASSTSTWELQRKLTNLALTTAGPNTVSSTFSLITPTSAVAQVVVGGGGRGSFSAGAAPAASSVGYDAAPAAEEKKEEKVEEKEESDDDMGFSLFD